MTPLHRIDLAALPFVDLAELCGAGEDALWVRPAEALPYCVAPLVYGDSGTTEANWLSKFATTRPLPTYVHRVNNARVYGHPVGRGLAVGHGGLRVHDGGSLFTTADGGYTDESLLRHKTFPVDWLAPESTSEIPTVISGPVELVAGDHLYLGNNDHHFGHFIVDTLARTWPLLLADPHFATMRILYTGDPLVDWQLQLLSPLGFSADRLVHVAEVAQVERLYVPSLGYVAGKGTSLAFDRVLTHLGDQLEDTATSPHEADKVFLSRSLVADDVRALAPGEAARLDAYFAERGFKVLHPQTLPLSEQIRIVRQASVVVGLTGSANHLIGFCHNAPLHLVISPSTIRNWHDFGLHSPKGSTPSYLFTGQLDNETWTIDFDQLDADLQAWHAECDDWPASLARRHLIGWDALGTVTHLKGRLTAFRQRVKKLEQQGGNAP